MLKLDPIFSDHALIQHGVENTIKGWASPNETIHVVFHERSFQTISNKEGEWSIVLPPFLPIWSTECKVYTEREMIEIHDIAIGDLYLAAGQSNMEYKLEDEANYPGSAKDMKPFRFLIVPPVEYIQNGQEVPSFEKMNWKNATIENIKTLSAVSFYAIQEIAKKTKIPLGIVGCYKGGTSASCWIDEEVLKHNAILKKEYYDTYWTDIKDQSEQEEDQKRNAYQEKLQDYTQKVEAYQKQYPDRSLSQLKHDLGHTPWPGPKGNKDFGRPSGLYHTMFSKIKDLSFKAVWWYQGEEDAKHADIYAILLGTLIDSWRIDLHDSLPFFLVQLPNYIETTYPETWPILREAQMKNARGKEDVEILCALDCGDDYNIHPIDKTKIGKRLGQLVLKTLYDFNELILFPILKRWKRVDQDIVLEFSNIEDGTILLEVDGFEHEYRIEEGKTVVPNAKLTISYAYKNNPKSLVMHNELPMFPFYLNIE